MNGLSIIKIDKIEFHIKFKISKIYILYWKNFSEFYFVNSLFDDNVFIN